jgi:hypothetical protein
MFHSMNGVDDAETATGVLPSGRPSKRSKCSRTVAVRLASTLRTAQGTLVAAAPVEAVILESLGGKPWTTRDLKKANLQDARAVWRSLRTAAGFAATSNGWATTDKTNVKLGKAGLPTIGITLLPADSAKQVWDECDATTQVAIAAAVGLTAERITQLMNITVCPCATTGCTCGCVVGKSQNGQRPTNQRARLIRNVLTLTRPDAALILTADALRHVVVRAGGKSKARWRVNVGDDIRWELLAPGLFSVAPKAYTYTKWSTSKRPVRTGLSIVYSASEKWSDATIVSTCEAGYRVAVVFDCKKKDLPTVWNGVPVVDGDKTDDLWRHPAGHIVGLAVKGPTKAIKRTMADCGFAR